MQMKSKGELDAVEEIELNRREKKVVRSKLWMREIIVERNRVEEEDYKSVLKFTLK